MSDRRQKNQLLLAFAEEDRSEAPNGLGGGTESFTAKRGTESPGIGTNQGQQRKRRHGRDDRSTVAVISETALAGDPGTVAERNL